MLHTGQPVTAWCKPSDRVKNSRPCKHRKRITAAASSGRRCIAAALSRILELGSDAQLWSVASLGMMRVRRGATLRHSRSGQAGLYVSCFP